MAFHPFEVLLVAIAISLDNLAASLALGARTAGRERFRVAAVFALFGGAAPVAGVLLGRTLTNLAAAWAEWIGIAALAGIGVWTVTTAVRHRGERSARDLPRRPGAILLLGATLSIDNLIVGLGLGLHGAEPVVLGVSAAGMVFAASFGGLYAGRIGYARWGAYAEGAAGVLLILIAIGIGMGHL